MKRDDSKSIVLVESIVNFGIKGFPPLLSSAALATEYLSDKSYASNDARVDSLINWETSKNFGSGFLTGLGGLITLPVAVPTALSSSWVIQARMSATIAIIYGWNSRDDRVQTMVLLSLLGDSAKEVAKKAGITISKKIATNAILSIPGRILIEINKKVGFRLITKAGEKGVINLVKAVPFLGGFVGGTFDAVTCSIVGKTAKSIFKK